jgi:4-hydroxythreonine-4-phosphate dehydrogenase
LVQKSLIAVTMGDPAGIGPEVIASAWRHETLFAQCRPVVVGHAEIMRRALALVGAPSRVEKADRPDSIAASSTVLPCVQAVSDDVLDVVPGRVDRRAGQAAYDALMAATELALTGCVDAVVTAPLNKLALAQAGHRFPGHTELLAHRCGVSDFAMMLYLGPGEFVRSPRGLGVVHLTLHMALADVFSHLTRENIVAKIHLADAVMRRLAGPAGGHGRASGRPKIGVCALNPHAGEQGLFGREETEIIEPAVRHAAAAGIEVSGPYPADTLLARARDGEFDAVVAMYHDQGHIALKLLDRHTAVNITLGLPIVRTSVAHGTAFDLAWQGRADCRSVLEAVRVAALLSGAR